MLSEMHHLGTVNVVKISNLIYSQLFVFEGLESDALEHNSPKIHVVTAITTVQNVENPHSVLAGKISRAAR